MKQETRDVWKNVGLIIGFAMMLTSILLLLFFFVDVLFGFVALPCALLGMLLTAKCIGNIPVHRIGGSK